jgi:hypothetical protein
MLQALAKVPITDFSQPAPIPTLADKLNQQARQAQPITPGGERSPSDTPPGGPYEYGPPEPKALPPTTTTTTTAPGGPPGPGGTTTTTLFPIP